MRRWTSAAAGVVAEQLTHPPEQCARGPSRTGAGAFRNRAHHEFDEHCAVGARTGRRAASMAGSP